ELAYPGGVFEGFEQAKDGPGPADVLGLGAVNRNDEVRLRHGRDLGLRPFVVVIGVSRSGPGARFDRDPMAGGDQPPRAVGSDRHPALSGAPRGEGVNVNDANGGRNRSHSAYRTLYA